MKSATVLSALLLVAGLSGVAVLQASDTDLRRPQLQSINEIVTPADLRSLSMDKPSVTFQVVVDENGKLIDCLALEATHYELLEQAERWVKRASFSPGQEAGKPTMASTIVSVYFFDPAQRAYFDGAGSLPYGSSSMGALTNRTYQLDKARFVYRRAEVSELDTPVTLRTGKIMVLTDAAGKKAEGNCVVEYTIDSHGNVCVPSVLETDNEIVSKSALMTVLNMRFAPPTRARGVPTYVRVRQPMSFVADGGAAHAALK